MIKKNPTPFSFFGGFAQNDNFLWIVAIVDEAERKGSSLAQIMRWDKKIGQWGAFITPFRPIGVWAKDDMNWEVVAVGEMGQVVIKKPSADIREEKKISDSTRPLCDLKFIGSHLHVVGMGRQVYKRIDSNKWFRVDEGTFVAPDQIDLSNYTAKGFNAIDGIVEDNMYAVGYAGEIWNYNGKIWVQLNSPVKQILNAVKVIDTGEFFIVSYWVKTLAFRRRL